MTTNQIKQITAKFTGKCTMCGGVIPSGARCNWVKGVGVRHISADECSKDASDLQQLGREIAQKRLSEKQVAVTMGVFKKDGRIYVVKPNREKTRVYAKEIVESPARMTENGAVVDFETRYAPGIVFKLTEADRWDLADAKDFLTKFARCIVCGRHLKAAKSVAGSIGPVCAGYFKNSSHVNGCAHHDNAASKEAAAAVLNSIAKSPNTLGEITDMMIANDAAAERAEFERETDTAEDMLARDARKNAQLNMTDDQKALLVELKRLNAESRRWMQGGPDRWAGILTEDIAYWAESGIKSVDDLHEDQRRNDEKERRKASYDYGFTDDEMRRDGLGFN